MAPTKDAELAADVARERAIPDRVCIVRGDGGVEKPRVPAARLGPSWPCAEALSFLWSLGLYAREAWQQQSHHQYPATQNVRMGTTDAMATVAPTPVG